MVDDENVSGETSSAAEPGSVDPLPEAPARSEAPTYRVTLACPTPLVSEVVECVAESEAEAIAAFNLANGISATIHPYTVEKL